MTTTFRSDAGMSLIETLIAILVLTVGAVGMAATFLQGMQFATSSPNELVATQKAAEAMESVFSARDAHTLTWEQLMNEADGGVFKDKPDDLRLAGPDGIVNTRDDGEVEFVWLPGPDDDLRTSPDNRKQALTGFTRQIVIERISKDLRSVTVVIEYPSGAARKKDQLTSYISKYA
jgi:type II secretory pathway pseudopilin PulG